MEFSKSNQEQLSKWIGSRKKYTMLFKATKNGCSAKAFHNTCDNKGPTVTILYNTDNSVFGGYTSVRWRSSGGYLTDEKAFMFRLYRNGKWNPVQMKINNASKAINDQASFGPTFGGHDLHTFSGTVNIAGTHFPLNGSTNFGHSYTMRGEDYNSITNGHLKVKDIEVYLVEDLPQGATLDTPWRITPECNTQIKLCQYEIFGIGDRSYFVIGDGKALPEEGTDLLHSTGNTHHTFAHYGPVHHTGTFSVIKESYRYLESWLLV